MGLCIYFLHVYMILHCLPKVFKVNVIINDIFEIEVAVFQVCQGFNLFSLQCF